MNIAELLRRSAASHGERPALAFGSEPSASYGEFLRNALRLGRFLQGRLGAGAGDRIALYCRNHPSYLEAMYAAWSAGLAVVPINAKLHAREARFILDDSGAIACWTDADRDADLRQAGVSIPLLDIDAMPSLRASEPAALTARADADLAWLFYTSGTTGKPKGVMLSHGNLLATTQAYLAEVRSVVPGEALLHAAPLSHGSGLYNFAYVAHAGVNVVPASRAFDETEIFELSATYRGMAMFAAPTMVTRLVAHAARRPHIENYIGTIIYGGGPMYLADIEQALRVMGQRFVQIYGQGESPMTITLLPRHVIADDSHPRYRDRLASVGHPYMSVEVSIRDASGSKLPVGAVGEVCVRGGTVMNGYWNNPEATRAAIRDGWLYTGDLGVLDEEGFLTLKDRSKDVIISGGTNIYPREVEEALLADPRVREVSVVGVPDEEWGEKVVAFVVGEAITAAELDALCLERIARFKRPKHYRFVSELPKNNYGKVLKTSLREQLAATQSRGIRAEH